MRCAPMVVPLLPPIGAAGVGSLNPSPGPSPLITWMITARAAGGAAAERSAHAKAIARAAGPRRGQSLMRSGLSRYALVSRWRSRAGLTPHRSLKTAAQIDLYTTGGHGYGLADQVLGSAWLGR